MAVKNEFIDRLARVETNTDNILKVMKDIQSDRKEHLKQCHDEMEKHWLEIQENTRFKNITIKLFWLFMGSSGGGIILLIVYHGIKAVIGKGII